MDIVYILKSESLRARPTKPRRPPRARDPKAYQELKFSLRSLKNLEHDKIFIVGGCPQWVQNVYWIPAKDESPNKQLNVLSKIILACNTPDISEDFILMNDDFFLLTPTTAPYLNKGKLKQTVVNKEFEYRRSNYWHYLQKTSELFEDPWDFELHYPFVYNKTKFLELSNYYNLQNIYLLRSLYGNHYKIKSEYSPDFKAYTLAELNNMLQSPFLSSMDTYATHTNFIKPMTRVFPNRSFYEK